MTRYAAVHKDGSIAFVIDCSDLDLDANTPDGCRMIKGVPATLPPDAMRWDGSAFVEIVPSVSWADVRAQRNALLSACDFRALPDAPGDTAEWLAYRQSLRDIIDPDIEPAGIKWPIPPGD